MELEAVDWVNVAEDSDRPGCLMDGIGLSVSTKGWEFLA
jgi:hypothetical protein